MDDDVRDTLALVNATRKAFYHPLPGASRLTRLRWWLVRLAKRV